MKLLGRPDLARGPEFESPGVDKVSNMNVKIPNNSNSIHRRKESTQEISERIDEVLG